MDPIEFRKVLIDDKEWSIPEWRIMLRPYQEFLQVIPLNIRKNRYHNGDHGLSVFHFVMCSEFVSLFDGIAL